MRVKNTGNHVAKNPRKLELHTASRVRATEGDGTGRQYDSADLDGEREGKFNSNL